MSGTGSLIELIMAIEDQIEETLRKQSSSRKLNILALCSPILEPFSFFLRDDADEAEAAYCSEAAVAETTLKINKRNTTGPDSIFVRLLRELWIKCFNYSSI